MNLYNGSTDGESQEEVGITFEEYEAHKKACEEVIAQSDIAARLTNNPDFQALIIGVYMQDEPKRLGQLIASGRLTPKATEDAFADLKSVGNLNRFMSNQLQRGDIARQELKDLQEAWDAHVTAQSEQDA